MALSQTRLQAAYFDDIERQIREIAPKANDDRLAELAELVGLNLGGGRARAISATPISPSDRNQENGPEADQESAQNSAGPVEQASDDAEGRGPDQPDAPAPRALERSQRRSRALGLALPILLATVGAGVAVAMRAAPTDAVGSKVSAIKAQDPPAHERQVTSPDVQVASQPPMEPPGSSAEPAEAVATPTTPIVTASAPPPDPPQPATVSSLFGTPRRVNTVSIKPDLTAAPKGELEITPLPPTKPKALTSTTTVKAGHATRNEPHVGRGTGSR